MGRFGLFIITAIHDFNTGRFSLIIIATIHDHSTGRVTAVYDFNTGRFSLFLFLSFFFAGMTSTRVESPLSMTSTRVGSVLSLFTVATIQDLNTGGLPHSLFTITTVNNLNRCSTWVCNAPMWNPQLHFITHAGIAVSSTFSIRSKVVGRLSALM